MTVDVSAGRAPDHFHPLPLLTAGAARTEAERCLYCYDAPCTRACPTTSTSPRSSGRSRRGTSRKRAHDPRREPSRGNVRGRLPGRAPVRGRCVRNDMDQPITIGRLQRYAVESHAAAGGEFFAPNTDAGVSVAIIGAGPAGLACAAQLRRAGIAVTVYDAKPRAGGLGDHRIVPWRLPRETVEIDVAQVERAGVQFMLGSAVGRDVEPGGPACRPRCRRGRHGPGSREEAAASRARIAMGSSTRST